MGDRDVRIRIEAVGGAETSRALAGIRREAEATTNASKRASELPFKPTADVARESARVFADAEEAKRRAMRATTREAETQIRAQVRAEETGARERLRALQSFASAAVSIFQVASARAEGFSGAFGGRSREALLSSTASYRQDLSRVSVNTGVRRSELQRITLSASRASGLDAQSFVRAIAIGQDVGGAPGLAAVRGSLSRIGETSAALGLPPETLASLVGDAASMGMQPNEAGALLDQIAGIVSTNRLDPEALQDRFGPRFRRFAALTGTTGSEATAGTLRLYGSLAAAGYRGRELSTATDEVLRTLDDRGFRRRASRVLGGPIAEGGTEGVIRDPFDALGRLAASPDLRLRGDVERRLGLDGDRAGGLYSILESIRRGGGALPDVRGATAADGRRLVDDTMRELSSDRAYGLGARQFADFQEQGQAFYDAASRTAEVWSSLNARMPGTITALGDLAAAASSASSMLGSLSLAFGGTSAGGGVAAALVAAGPAIGAAIVAGMAVAIVGGQLRENASREREFYSAGGEAGRTRRMLDARRELLARSTIGTEDGLGGIIPAASWAFPHNGDSTRAATIAPFVRPASAWAGGFGGSMPGRPTEVRLSAEAVSALAGAIGESVRGGGARGPSERGGGL